MSKKYHSTYTRFSIWKPSIYEKNLMAKKSLYVLIIFFMMVVSLWLWSVKKTQTMLMLDTNHKLTNIESRLKSQDSLFFVLRQHILGDYKLPARVDFLNHKINLESYPMPQIINPLFQYLLHVAKWDLVSAFQRFHFYEAAIDDSLAKNNLPLDLKYVILAESMAYPKAVSTANAVGPYQFLKFTSVEFGAEVNKWFDMRRDIWYMSKTFCDYIEYLKNKTGSIEMALRAYNTGFSRFMKAAERQSWVKKSWFIDTNAENNLYLFWIITFKIIYENQKKYGLYIDYSYKPMTDLKIVRIELKNKAEIEFLDLAQNVGVSPMLLKILNPAFIKTNSANNYVIGGNPHEYKTVRYIKLPPVAKVENLKKLANQKIKINF